MIVQDHKMQHKIGMNVEQCVCVCPEKCKACKLELFFFWFFLHEKFKSSFYQPIAQNDHNRVYVN